MFKSPMLLHKVDQPYDDSTFITELKLDGIRLLYSKTATRTFLYSRHQNDITSRFPELHELPIPPDTILDGEVIFTDPITGTPDFEALMHRFSTTNREKTIRLANLQPVSYVVFDILIYKGKNVTSLPLLERKALLEEVIPKDTPLLSKVQFIEGHGNVYFNLIKEKSLEGIVLKKKDSKYEIGKRSKSWLKVINYQYENVRITGIRKKEFGWLLSFEDGQPAGIMELGVPIDAKQTVHHQSHQLKVNENNEYIYLKPELSCQVKFRNLTKAGLLRTPAFVSM
ncbi:ATP-dependent DNA ligase [Litchfieldia alkalitelluris]|uniref:ATP-dependent DNA ligase n=1 Tax=Litchfieldia alkalitelluris TaxID=304268 RepID=UPI00099716A9|nr:RNA ligase family protein [Litchfieldia alkalitelluris]